MKLKEARQILKKHNKWRKGAEIEMTEPQIISQAIDVLTDQEKILIDFQFYLHKRQLIKGFEWDYEYEAKRFLKR